MADIEVEKDISGLMSQVTLDDKLEKIRTHKSSGLAHQKHLSVILSAIEENLEEEKASKSAAAYFVSLLSLLDQSISSNSIINKELALSSVYLLDLVAPFVSPSILRVKFNPIVSKLALVFTATDDAEVVDAPLLRPSIGVLETILLSQDNSSWTSPSTDLLNPKRAVMVLLELALDSRPKVRRRAIDAVTKILTNPPPSPKLEHPASELCADVALGKAADLLKQSRSHKANTASDKGKKVIHSIQLVRAITTTSGWPIDKVEGLCEVLLSVSKTTDQHLVMAAFDVFESLFKSIDDDSSKFVKVLDIMFEDLIPSINDQHLAPAWLAVIAQAGDLYSNLEPMKCFTRLPAVFEIISNFLESEIENIRISACQCLVALSSTAIKHELLLLPDKKSKESKKTYETSEKILSKLSQIVLGLLHIRYQSSWKEAMEILVALFDQLRWRASPHLINCLKVVGTLRSEESFSEGRDGADKVIGAAIRAIGPEEVLKHLPLKLDPYNETAPAKAWLLPLLRENIYNADIGYFISEFIPLADSIHKKASELQEKLSGASKNSPLEKEISMQIKVYQTIYDQIWSLFTRYADLPLGFKSSFTEKFAQLLATQMYERVGLRPGICQGLRSLVESYKSYCLMEEDEELQEQEAMMIQRLPITEVKENLKILTETFDANILLILANMYAAMSADGRSYVLDTIVVYLEIARPTDVDSAFQQAATNLFNVLQEISKELQANDVKKTLKVNDKIVYKQSLDLMDLIVAFTPYLPKSSHEAILNIFKTCIDIQQIPLMQKKSFRLLSRLSETEDGVTTISSRLNTIQKIIIEATDKISSPARGARLNALSKIINILPSNELHFVPSIISETVLSTKDLNEKTREAAFNLLVQCGQRMKEGGVVQNSKVIGMEEDAPNVEASLEEFFTMVSAGLAGSTPHMISSTITSLSRILFEFRNDINSDMLSELSSTVELFLTSNNREIVKSTLGFVKITAISLPDEIVRPALKSLIGNLLVWSREHKSHFKAKVKHIIERLIRRFGFETIQQNFPLEDLKLLTNIRKSKERAKRNKSKDEDQDEVDNTKKSRTYANEFDEAVYGSSSEDDENSSGDEAPANGKKKTGQQKYILEQDDEPLDLLDRRSLAHISSSKPKAKQDKPSIKESARFEKDHSGRIIVKREENRKDDDIDLISGIDAYVDAIKNAPVKGQRNRLKYKRSRKHNQESDDEDEGQEEVATKKRIVDNRNKNKAIVKKTTARRKL